MAHSTFICTPLARTSHLVGGRLGNVDLTSCPRVQCDLGTGRTLSPGAVSAPETGPGHSWCAQLTQKPLSMRLSATWGGRWSLRSPELLRWGPLDMTQVHRGLGAEPVWRASLGQASVGAAPAIDMVGPPAGREPSRTASSFSRRLPKSVPSCSGGFQSEDVEQAVTCLCLSLGRYCEAAAI